MRLRVQIGFAGLALSCAVLFCRSAAAAPQQPDGAARSDTAGFSPDRAVARAALDAYRGGFTIDSGLSVTFGIERIVTIDGQVAERSQLQLGDLGRLTSGQAALPAEAAAQLSVIQNGVAGLSLRLGSSVLGGTLIQNSLNNQLINHATIINASVSTQGMLQAMNFQSTLSNALNIAATPR